MRLADGIFDEIPFLIAMIDWFIISYVAKKKVDNLIMDLFFVYFRGIKSVPKKMERLHVERVLTGAGKRLL